MLKKYYPDVRAAVDAIPFSYFMSQVAHTENWISNIRLILSVINYYLKLLYVDYLNLLAKPTRVYVHFQNL